MSYCPFVYTAFLIISTNVRHVSHLKSQHLSLQEQMNNLVVMGQKTITLLMHIMKIYIIIHNPNIRNPNVSANVFNEDALCFSFFPSLSYIYIYIYNRG